MSDSWSAADRALAHNGIMFWCRDVELSRNLMLKLKQNQVWKLDGGYVRIVRLERLAVGFKRLDDLGTRDGLHEDLTKKEFCRMIKSGTLMAPEEVLAAQGEMNPPIGDD